MRPLDPLFSLLRQAACLLLLAPLMALAQGLAPAPDAANPDAPGAPLIHPDMPALQPGNDAPSANAWREAHDAVAAFPRGHADILAWEKQPGAKPASAPHQPMHHPAHKPMHRQGGKP